MWQQRIRGATAQSRPSPLILRRMHDVRWWERKWDVTLYKCEPGTWEKAIKRLMNTGHREKYRIAIHVRDLYVSWAFVGDKINLTGTFSWFRALVMIDFIHVYSFLCITHVLFTLRAITYVSGSRIRLHSTGVLQALINDLMTRKRRARYRMLIYCKGSPI